MRFFLPHRRFVHRSRCLALPLGVLRPGRAPTTWSWTSWPRATGRWSACEATSRRPRRIGAAMEAELQRNLTSVQAELRDTEAQLARLQEEAISSATEQSRLSRPAERAGRGGGGRYASASRTLSRGRA